MQLLKVDSRLKCPSRWLLRSFCCCPWEPRQVTLAPLVYEHLGPLAFQEAWEVNSGHSVCGLLSFGGIEIVVMGTVGAVPGADSPSSMPVYYYCLEVICLQGHPWRPL